MTLGARVLKTGISITVALFLCSLLQLKPGIFAAVAAVFTIQPTIYRTWRQVLDQLQANTIGAIIALTAVYFLGDQLLAVGLVSIIVIMICLRLKMESSIGLTVVTVLAIMDAPGDDLLFALNRFFIILIGIGSAFAVNLLIMPPKHAKQFVESLRRSFASMSLLHRTLISNELKERAFKEQHAEFMSSLEKLDDLFGSFDEERRKLGRLRPADLRELVVFKQMLHVLHKGNDILEIAQDHYFQSRTHPDENDWFDKHMEELSKYHEQILLRFEGKLKDKEPRRDEWLRLSGDFMNKVMELYKEDPEDKLRLVLVGSSIFEYSFQLQRLERLVEHYTEKQGSPASG